MRNKVRLDSVAKVDVGRSVPVAAQLLEPEHDAIAYLRGVPDFGDVTPRPRFYVSGVVPQVHSNDLLISVSRSDYSVNMADQPYVAGSRVIFVRADTSKVDAEYLRFALNQELSKALLSDALAKTDPVRNTIEALEFMFPAISQQHADARLLLARESEITRLLDATQRIQAELTVAFTNMFKPIEERTTWLGLAQIGLTFKDHELFGYLADGHHRVETLTVSLRQGVGLARVADFSVVDKATRVIRINYGDFVLSRRLGVIASVGAAHLEGEVLALKNGVELLRPNADYLDPRFASAYLTSPQVLSVLDSMKSKSGGRWIRQAELENARLPVPSMPEQRKYLELAEPLQLEIQRLQGQVVTARRSFGELCKQVFGV